MNDLLSQLNLLPYLEKHVTFIHILKSQSDFVIIVQKGIEMI